MEEQFKKQVLDHINREEPLLTLHHRALFGDDMTGEIGMKDKIDEVYTIIKEAAQEKKGVDRLWDSIKGKITLLILIASALLVIKSWGIVLLKFLIPAVIIGKVE